MARIGGLISDRRMAAVRKAETGLAQRVLSIFDDVDVVITPGTAAGPSRIGAYQRRGAVRTLTLVGAAGAVPGDVQRDGATCRGRAVGSRRDGVPTSIQLVGRPFDEATLLSLGAQIEKARPWAQRRPPVS